ncbi:Ankyrin repeat domain-containing protein 40 [Geranomyces michiganensis]|nr:Ankyrin repeat domain-containing protein 40 [Geranomyces michiganensis]
MTTAREEALRESAALGQADKVLFYLQTAGVNVNAQNAVNGWSALHWAAQRGNAEVVSLLLSNGADEGLKNSKGQTAAELAKRDEVRALFVNVPPSPPKVAEEAAATASPPPAFVPAYLATPASDLLFSVPVSEQPGFASAENMRAAPAGPVPTSESAVSRSEPPKPAPVVAAREEAHTQQKPEPTTTSATSTAPACISSTQKDLPVNKGIQRKELLVYVNERKAAQLIGAVFFPVDSSISDVLKQIDRELLVAKRGVTKVDPDLLVASRGVLPKAEQTQR